ncbi:MAG TPA: adenosylcobinamide-GDP ribazoletransferase [Dehalococcoidia bacterium]|nr:adenosylcobinamide-GDP ribazoletransferase [Dehalococcoidia bacterium]
MALLVAIRFLTTIRLPWRREASHEEFVRSVGYYPVVGFLIGLILYGLWWLLSPFLPPSIVNILLIIALVVISGALHLDGFVDTCDGIGGHKTPEERWRVLHDSRVGGFGVIGACCLLLVKFITLNSVPEPLLMMTLILMPVVSRWAMVYAIFIYPYAQPSGLGKERKQATDLPRFIEATIIALAVAVVLAWPAWLAGLAIMAGIWVVVMVMGAYFKGKFAGLTGDTYGAINEVAEVCVLILICLLAHNQWLGLT